MTIDSRWCRTRLLGVCLSLLAGGASAGVTLQCDNSALVPNSAGTATTQAVVINEFYTGSGSFVEIYFNHATDISGWGIFLTESSGNDFSLKYSLATGAGTAYVPGVSGSIPDNSTAYNGTFPAGTYITYPLSAPDAKAEILLATTNVKSTVNVNGAAVVADYFYYNGSNTGAFFFSVPSSCGTTLLTHSTSSKDMSRSTDGSGSWVDNGGTTTQGSSNNPGAINHVGIFHDGLGVTCEPETITIKACADPLCTTLNTSSVTNVTLNGSGWSANPIAFTGWTTVNLSISSPQTVALATVGSTYKCYNVAAGTSNCGLVFSDSAFLIDAVPTQVAGVVSAAITIRAVEKDSTTATCKGKFNGNQTLEIASQCIDPVACAGKQMAINGTSVQNNPASGIASYTSVPLTFTGATSAASISLNYPDVGKMNFTVRYPLGGSRYMLGTSNTFVVKPYSITATNIVRNSDATANPAPINASGQRFVQAGNGDVTANQFRATITSIAANGAPTPNFGKEILQEGVRLVPIRISDAALTSNGVMYVGTAAGGLVGGLNFFSNGSRTQNDLGWDEVGIMQLMPGVGDGDYLGGGDVAVVTASPNIGRFYPASFELATANVVAACGLPAAGTDTTYMGQSFQLPMTIEARNSLGGVTRNYHGAYAKGTVSFAVENGDDGNNLAARLTAPAAAWNSGSYAITATNDFSFARPASLTPDATWGPFDNLRYGVKVEDPDGPAQASLDMNPAVAGCAPCTNTHRQIGSASSRQRLGRLHLQNAFGSERLPLQVRYEVQHWTGTGFALNALDTCTAIQAGHVGLGSYGGGLTGMPASPVAVTSGVASGTIVVQTPLQAGSLRLSVDLGGAPADLSPCPPAWAAAPAPSAGANLTHLRYRWCGGGYNDPTALLTFGIYGGSNRFIYRREVR